MLAVDGEAARLRRSTAAAEGTITAGGPHAARQGRVAVSRAGATTSKEDEYKDIDHKKPTFFSAGGWWTWTRSPARQRLIIPIFWNHKEKSFMIEGLATEFGMDSVFQRDGFEQNHWKLNYNMQANGRWVCHSAGCAMSCCPDSRTIQVH